MTYIMCVSGRSLAFRYVIPGTGSASSAFIFCSDGPAAPPHRDPVRALRSFISSGFAMTFFRSSWST